MLMRTSIGILAAVLVGAFAACRLPEDGATVMAALDQEAHDGGAVGPVDRGARVGPSSPVSAPPQGWEYVVYMPDRSAPCPSGFDAVDGLTDHAGAACACAATCTASGADCSTGTIKNHRHDSRSEPANAACDNSTSDIAIPSATYCHEFSPAAPFQVGHIRSDPPPAKSNGRCSYAGIATGTTSASAVRVCHPRDAGTDATACIERPGTLDCPSEGAFSVRHVVADGARVRCADCGCALEAVSCTGFHSYFAESGCKGDSDDVVVDGGCNAMKREGAIEGYRSWRYTGVPDKYQCGPAAAAAPPSYELENARTVCCREP
jgi:hypothetical protein